MNNIQIVLPPLLFTGIQRYIQDGIIPGSFLKCVLSNDLMGSYARADTESRKYMRELVAFIEMCIPPEIRGNTAILLDHCSKMTAQTDKDYAYIGRYTDWSPKGCTIFSSDSGELIYPTENMLEHNEEIKAAQREEYPEVE